MDKPIAYHIAVTTDWRLNIIITNKRREQLRSYSHFVTQEQAAQFADVLDRTVTMGRYTEFDACPFCGKTFFRHDKLLRVKDGRTLHQKCVGTAVRCGVLNFRDCVGAAFRCFPEDVPLFDYSSLASNSQSQSKDFRYAIQTVSKKTIHLFLIEPGGRITRHTCLFKLVQDLMEPSAVKGKTQFHLLMSKLPEDHMARWLSDSALKTSEQAMASVMSTLFSRLNSFLDSDLEQIICFDSSIDAKTFAQEKCAIFLVLPEEDPTKNFMAGLMIQNLSRELFTLADTYGGKLPNRVVFFCDELGTMPPFDILPLFSAGRSRRLTLVPIIQSLAQLEKNYGKEGSEIIQDNTQDTIFGGFAPGSQTAEVLSKSLGSRTVQTGYVNQSKNDPSQSLQMAGKPLMTPDELKALPKGEFVVMKTGRHPMRTRLRLFLEWGITFEEPYIVPPREDAQVRYAGRRELMNSIMQRYEFAQSRSGAMPLDSEKGERNKNTAGMKT